MAEIAMFSEKTIEFKFNRKAQTILSKSRNIQLGIIQQTLKVEKTEKKFSTLVIVKEKCSGEVISDLLCRTEDQNHVICTVNTLLCTAESGLLIQTK